MEVKSKLERKAAYNAYDNTKYEHEYFDEETGGYLVIEQQRIAQSQQNKQEKAKFEKELAMCMALAQNGYAIVYLKDTQHGYDILLNGTPADLKKTATHNNIEKYAKKAVREQGAKMVVFEFEAMTGRIHDELNRIKRAGIEVKYFVSESEAVIDL